MLGRKSRKWRELLLVYSNHNRPTKHPSTCTEPHVVYLISRTFALSIQLHSSVSTDDLLSPITLVRQNLTEHIRLLPNCPSQRLHRRDPADIRLANLPQASSRSQGDDKVGSDQDKRSVLKGSGRLPTPTPFNPRPVSTSCCITRYIVHVMPLCWFISYLHQFTPAGSFKVHCWVPL